MLNTVEVSNKRTPKVGEYVSPTETLSPEDDFRLKFAKLLKGKSRVTMTITPDMARVMLETNIGNRHLCRNSIIRFASDMTNGLWEVTGEPIIFSNVGILNDGQHRLAACIRSGVSFDTDVRFGVAREAFRVTNIGKKRQLSDVLGIEGNTNCTALAGALNWLHRYYIGLPSSVSTVLSTTDGLALLTANPEMCLSTSYSGRASTKPKIMTPSLAIFLHYAFAVKDRKKADDFFESIITGLGITGAKDPRHQLRNRLIDNGCSKAKLPDVYIAAITIKAWNAVRQGKPLSCLRYQGTNDPDRGIVSESFPVIS